MRERCELNGMTLSIPVAEMCGKISTLPNACLVEVRTAGGGGGDVVGAAGAGACIEH